MALSNLRQIICGMTSVIRSYTYAFKLKRSELKKQVMFFTFQGSYVCNPKYICEQLHRIDPNVECVWVTYQDNTKKFPGFVKTVTFGEPEYYEKLYTSKVLIDNAFNFQKRFFRKKTNQYYIETMHGSLGIKRIGPEANQNRRRNAKGFRNGEQADYIISNSRFENMVYRESFWKHTPILMLGHARNDLLASSVSSELVERCRCAVRAFYHLPDDAMLAMYAPTFQRQTSQRCEELDLQCLRESLNKRFGGEWYVLKRMHPRDARNAVKPDSRYILDGGAYEDIQELMAAIDFGITDYSSWIFDYIVSGQKGLLYVPDLKSYQNDTGFYYPLDTTPFPIALNNQMMQKAILEFDTLMFEKKLEEFLSDKGCVDDGTASEKAAKVVLNLLNNQRPGNELVSSNQIGNNA